MIGIRLSQNLSQICNDLDDTTIMLHISTCTKLKFNQIFDGWLDGFHNFS